MQNKKLRAIKQLQLLQNIGPATAERLYSVGITSLAKLKKSNPEKVYEKLKKSESTKLDKCVLYQLQGAILDVPWWLCKKSSNKNRR